MNAKEIFAVLRENNIAEENLIGMSFQEAKEFAERIKAKEESI